MRPPVSRADLQPACTESLGHCGIHSPEVSGSTQWAHDGSFAVMSKCKNSGDCTGGVGSSQQQNFLVCTQSSTAWVG